MPVRSTFHKLGWVSCSLRSHPQAYFQWNRHPRKGVNFYPHRPRYAPPLRLDQSNLNSFHRIPSITKFDWPLTAKNKSSNNHSLFPWIILCEGNNYRMIIPGKICKGSEYAGALLTTAEREPTGGSELNGVFRGWVHSCSRYAVTYAPAYAPLKVRFVPRTPFNCNSFTDRPSIPTLKCKSGVGMGWDGKQLNPRVHEL